MRVGSSLDNHKQGSLFTEFDLIKCYQSIQCSSLQIGRVVVTCVVCGLPTGGVSFAVELALLCSETGTKIPLAL